MDANGPNNGAPDSPPRFAPLAAGIYPVPWGHPGHWPLIPDGRCGRMRTQKAQRIVAETDRDALLVWFADKGRQPSTSRDVYQRHVRRPLLWAAAEKQMAPSDLGPEELIEFLTFLRQPMPADRWITCDHRTYALGDHRWRPFAGSLSETTCRQAQSVLNDLFSFLADGRYLTVNPMPDNSSLRPRRRPGRSTTGVTAGLAVRVCADRVT
ncbi:hypothetical protein M0534_04635 [Methylonatrum kenyense]|uniref:hypothetical protein n=1 Tax=Methylonatrum kenyense TaxID=455253 RepID=UPI0020C0F177|nr:hypothetical protein [Methylonatrum kenyense]MCK8515614.1 hypothetical protein [Methylonatrum kenyense]